MSDEVAVEFRGVSKVYSRATILEIPILALPSGARIQVTGPNGAGKSTFLKLLAGITLPTRGAIVWHGEYRRRRVVFVPQSGGYISELSVAENAQAIALTLGAWASSLLDHPVMLEQFGLAEHLHRPMRQLSEGTRRLIVILAAVCARPSVLIADEPFAGIDENNEDMLRRHLNEQLPKDSIYVTSTHYVAQDLPALKISNAHLVS